MSELSYGTIIHLKNGKYCRIKKELGRGGQGVVYLVAYNGTDYAMKWYTASRNIESEDFYDNLIKNVNLGAPAPNFIWPLAVTERQYGSYGYVMKLRPSGFEEMSKFLLGQTKFSSPKAQLKACLQISKAFQRLHIMGLSYQDMNDGNFFINSVTGDVLICDNDNVAPDGNDTGIRGKAGYMAPEIVEGDSKPNRYTDYYSLAVCLFLLLYMNRPFEGIRYLNCPCDNNPLMARKLLGYNSVFIMNPSDSSNRPVKGVHDNVIRRWSIYPSLINEAFCRTFNKESLREGSKRLMDSQLYNILLQTRSEFVKCPNCGNECFVDTRKAGKPCIYCGTPFPPYLSLNVGRFIIPLMSGQIIYQCLISTEKDEDKKAGEVVTKKGVLGIINCSEYSWTITLTDNSMKIVNPGEGMPIKRGFKIKFGNKGAVGEII